VIAERRYELTITWEGVFMQISKNTQASNIMLGGEMIGIFAPPEKISEVGIGAVLVGK